MVEPTYRGSASVAREVDLMARIANGDRKAFEELYNLYHRRMARFLTRLTHRFDLAEEVINDTFWVVWRKARDFRGDSQPSTWILGIAYRKARNALRSSARFAHQNLEAESLTLTSSEEPFRTEELRDWLEQLHAGMGVTTLLVTHDQEEALELAEHVVVMFDGRIAQSGPPGEVYDHPASPKVASFLGGANLLTAPVFSGRADFGAVEVPAPDSARDGELLQVFVRPHDLKLRRVRAKHPGLAVARIERVKRIGGYVRISLALPGGESLTVESPRSEIDELGVAAGEPVLVDLRAARPFAEHAPQ